MLKNEKLKHLENVDYDLITEKPEGPDQGVIRHPSGVVVSADDVPRTGGSRRKSNKKNNKS
jgi:hypothetical protein